MQSEPESFFSRSTIPFLASNRFMKKILTIIGVVLCITGLLTLIQYLMDYQVLSEYSKGYVWEKYSLQ